MRHETIGFALLLLLVMALPRFVLADQVYTDVTSQMGIDVPGLGSGAAWSDLDDDGDLDLLVSTSTYPDEVYLYRNDDSVFTNVHAGSGLTNEARNFALGDYDNDGLDDIAIISFGYVPTKLYHNLGQMQFDDVSDTAGIFGTYSWRCAWTDYDDDGFLDLYLCGSTAYLFRNKGDGSFEECAAAAGVQTGGGSCAWLDYDNDGWEDCYVGRSDDNLLYHNLGDGTFEEVATSAGVNDPYGTAGVCSGDFDGDGYFDLYSVNISSPNNRLYHNLGNGTFEEITASAGVGDVGDGRTATFLDIDYDEQVDLFSSNHVNPNRLYHNNGNNTFTDIAPSINIDEPIDPFGTAFGDYDGDGDIDVFLATHFGNKLLRCDGLTNHWLKIRLIGSISNRSAIGAVVYCWDDYQSCARVDGGHGKGDYDSKTLEFGLGSWGGEIAVEIHWPSGLVQKEYFSMDQYVTIFEDSTGTPEAESAPAEAPVILSLRPNPAGEYCELRLGAMQDRDEVVRVAILDLAGRRVWSRHVQAADEAITLQLPVGSLSVGVYFVRMEAGTASETVRMAVLR